MCEELSKRIAATPRAISQFDPKPNLLDKVNISHASAAHFASAGFCLRLWTR
jgi:hypothetical protein